MIKPFCFIQTSFASVHFFIIYTQLNVKLVNFKQFIAQSTGAVEYTDCFSVEG